MSSTRRSFLKALVAAPLLPAAAKLAAQPRYVFGRFGRLVSGINGGAGWGIIGESAFEAVADGGSVVPAVRVRVGGAATDRAVAIAVRHWKPGVGDHTPELLAPWEIEGADD
jgi:hypothetical protein